MLDHLHIKNFLTFEKLEINQLKRVNLIAGRNNAGKTSLLQAINLICTERKGTYLNSILNERGVFEKSDYSMYNSLFNRNVNGLEKTFVVNNINFVKNKEKKWDYGLMIWERKKNGASASYSENVSPDVEILRYFDNFFTYVPFNSNFNDLVLFWDRIVLTPKEDDVVKILRETIDSNIIRFDVGRDKVRVRLEGVEKPVSIKTLGDGVQRILLLALSLANAQGKTLLIDEIELGLHYSVLEKLWEMIFKYSQLWNIQVFVTTHSKDAINAFHYISAQEKYINDAEFIRLQKNRKGESEAIIYDGEKLKEVLDLSLEIR